MTRFRYKALAANGSPDHGYLDAVDPEAAASELQARGLLVLQLAAVGQMQGPGWRRLVARPALSSGALAQFTQQLSILLGAGQPLDRALNLLAGQSGAKARRLLEHVRDQVKGGKALSAALGDHPSQFPPLYTSMVRAGEAGGSLATTLAQLAAYLERAQGLRGELINALIYPAFLVTGVLGSLALLMTYVVPQFIPMFADLDVPVPPLTQGLFWLARFFAAYGWLVLLLGAGGLMAMVAGLVDPARRLRRDRALLRSKLAGPLLRRVEIARLARTLGTLLSNGVPLLAALSIGQGVCGNRAMGLAVKQAADLVKGGAPLGASLATSELLPPLALQMMQVGEESGQLHVLLLKVADVFDSEAKRSTDRLLATLVPTLTLVMAALVAFIMLAIMLPLMSLTSNL